MNISTIKTLSLMNTRHLLVILGACAAMTLGTNAADAPSNMARRGSSDPVLREQQFNAIDAGDRYATPKGPRTLHRMAGAMVVQLDEAADRSAAAARLTMAGGPLAGYAVDTNRLRTGPTMLLHAPGPEAATHRVRPAAVEDKLGAARRAPGVRRANPLFLDPASGLFLTARSELIVRLKPGVDPRQHFGTEWSQVSRLRGMPDHYVVQVPQTAAAEIFAESDRRSALPDVSWAEPSFDLQVISQSVPNDTYYGKQWSLKNSGQSGGGVTNLDIKAELAWDITTGATNIVVAVVDTAIQLSHPDLAPNLRTNLAEIAGNGIDDDGNGYIDDVVGWNFGEGNNNVNPVALGEVHGTMVAGLAVGRGNNGQGVAGVAYTSRLLPIKFQNSAGTTTVPNAVEAITYAARYADVLNLSLGIPPGIQVIEDAFEAAATQGRGGRGCVVVAAAGNNDYHWERMTFDGVPAGSHTMSWTYFWNNSVSNSDQIYLGEVRLPGGPIYQLGFSNGTTLPTGWTLTGTPWTNVASPSDEFLSGAVLGALRSPALSGSQSSTIAVTWNNPAGLAASGHFEYRMANDSSAYVNFYLDGMLQWGRSGRGYAYGGVAYPAAHSRVIAVGAITDQNRRAAYSHFGEKLDVVAPSGGGVGVLWTTDRTGTDGVNANTTVNANNHPDYAVFSGTSGSSPIVAGVAALVLSANPNLSAEDVRLILRETAVETGPVAYTNGRNPYFGSGLVNAAAAVRMATNYFILPPDTKTGYVRARTLNLTNATISIGTNLGNTTLYVTNGGVLQHGAGIVGQATTSDTNTVVVGGPGAQWSLTNTLTVGESGSENRLIVATGGAVTSSTLIAGAQAASTTNLVQIDGGTVTSTTATDIRRGTLALNSGTLNAGLLRLTNSAGRINFNGGTLITTGASISNAQPFVVGQSGSATSIWNANLSAAPTTVQSNLVIGAGAPGVLNVLNGERVEAHGRLSVVGFDTSVAIGSTVTAAGSAAAVSGAGSTLWTAAQLIIGENSPFNSLTISSGGRVESGSGNLGANVFGRSNVVTVTGSGSVWTNRGTLYVGAERNFNRLVIDNGGRVDNATAYIGYDSLTLGNEALVQSGGVWNSSDRLVLGSFGIDGRLIVNNGTVIAQNSLLIGEYPAQATGNRLEVRPGTVFVKNAATNGVLEVRRGTNLFNGGLMDVDQLRLTSDTGFFEFNGGTLITRGGTIDNGQDFVVGRAGSTLDAHWVVARAATAVTINGGLTIGANGLLNSLEITNGGAVNVSGSAIIGAGATGATGASWLKVADAGSTLGAATLEVRRGTNILDGGSIVVDTLLLPNSAGRFVFSEGTLALDRATVNNGVPFHVGDGVNTAAYSMTEAGSLHSFANGLAVTNRSILQGNGTISGTLTLRGGATLAPGASSIGVITLNNPPVLQGRVVMAIGTNAVGATNDQLRVLGSLTYGGSLVVTNLGATPTNGSRYVLFTATGYAGAFNNFTFPPLPPPLIWTNKLLVDGSIEVITGASFFSDLAWWRGGESDPGATHGLGATSTANEYGGALRLLPSATYSSNIAATVTNLLNSRLALQFPSGSYGTNLLVTSVYDNFGLELWVKPDATNGLRCLAHNGIPNANGWGLYINNGQYRGLFGGIAYIGSATAPTNAWTHLALVRDNGVTTFYVNGISNASFANSPNVPSTRFTVAANLAADAFVGALDEIRVFNFAPGTFSASDLLYGATFLVTSTANAGPGSLRDVIAATPPGGKVRFAPHLAGQTITLTSGQISLSNSVTIDASSLSRPVRIDGNGSTRIFTVGSGVTATLQSLVITNGQETASSHGGGLVNWGVLTLNHCTVVNNRAGDGGGIINSNTLTANHCTFAGNATTRDGAGIYAGSGSQTTLNNCTLAKHLGRFGAGIFNAFGTVTLNNCTLAENAGTSGGGLYNSGGTALLTNSIVSLNNGGDIAGTAVVGANNLVGVAGLSLAPLGDYGGPTMTMPPSPGSPALDSGTDSVTNRLPIDQRGQARLLGAHVDIGAVEGAFNTEFPIANLTRLGDGTVQFNFANLSGPTYAVLASTNVAAPIANWLNLGTPTELPTGVFTFTDLQATNHPQRYYRVVKP